MHTHVKIVKAKEYNGPCALCDDEIRQSFTGEPCLIFKEKAICSNCYVSLAKEVYQMAGAGDGGLIHLIYKSCLSSSHNRSKRKLVPQYVKTLKHLLHKYNFMCVRCSSEENLTIDHIFPVSRGGSDDVENLQILCKSCNSKKGSKVGEAS